MTVLAVIEKKQTTLKGQFIASQKSINCLFKLKGLTKETPNTSQPNIDSVKFDTDFV